MRTIDIGRLDHGTKVRPELKHMKRMPSEYLRRFSYDTIGIERLDFLSVEEKNLIKGGTAARLLRL